MRYMTLTPFDPRAPLFIPASKASKIPAKSAKSWRLHGPTGRMDLTWRTTRQTSRERRELRRDYLEELLNEDGELRRPYGMRAKVFDALVNELSWLEMWG